MAQNIEIASPPGGGGDTDMWSMARSYPTIIEVNDPWEVDNDIFDHMGLKKIINLVILTI